MTDDERRDYLLATGTALYGKYWHSQLADDLNVTNYTIWSWTDGVTPVPPYIEDNLWYLLYGRLNYIQILVKKHEHDELPHKMIDKPNKKRSIKDRLSRKIFTRCVDK